jgi:HD superfamily phosphohydrolase
MVPSDFGSILASPEFIKLTRILQLGPTHLVYPGATHTRRAHSIGVFELGKRVIAALASKGGLDIVDATGARSFLVASLCHDLGHFPYAHSLKELPLQEHESLTARIVLGPLRKAVLEAGADPELVAAIVDQDMGAPDSSCRQALLLYRSMLSGVLDPDKLDYLNRDAWACGVPYGQQDVDFILQHLGLDASGRPGVSERGVMAVESVLFSKYQMYRAVYWHKSVRAATAMIKKAVIQALGSGTIGPDDLYGLDDHGFYSLLYHRSGDPKGLIQAVFYGSLYRLRLETAFDVANPAHRRAADLASRPGIEDEIAERAGVPDIIVDVPEPISFESDLPIIGTGSGFSSYATVFRPEVVASFTRALRVMRIFSSSKTDAAAARIEDAATQVLSRN